MDPKVQLFFFFTADFVGGKNAGKKCLTLKANVQIAFFAVFLHVDFVGKVLDKVVFKKVTFEISWLCLFFFV